MRFAKPRWPRSLGARLLGTYVAGTLISMTLIAAVFATMLSFQGDLRVKHDLGGQAALIGNALQFDATGRPVGWDESMIPRWIYDELGQESMFRVLDASGKVVLPSTAGLLPLAPEGQSFDPHRRSFLTAPHGMQMRAVTRLTQHAGQAWYVQLAVSERLVNLVVRSVGTTMLMRGILGACLILALVFASAMYFTLNRMLKPLREASESATRITPRTLDARLAVQGLPSELVPLIEAFNRALGRLEKGYRAQQDFLSAAAHELKTPLALIRAQVELDGGTTDRSALIKDVDQMARHVNQLLHLAEASELQNYEVGAVGATALMDEVSNYLSRLAQQRGVHLDLRVAPDLAFWQADRGALFTLLKNLLENAIQHSPPDGVVRLDADAQRISVRDEGSGIQAEHLPLIFGRFWRGPGRRDEGAGLGLSICQEIAVAHGWQLAARPAAPGTEFVLTFAPASAAGMATVSA